MALFFLGVSAEGAERYTVPFFLAPGASGDPQGVLRIVNDAGEAATVEVFAIADDGTRSGPATIALGAASAAEFDATELRSANAARGLSGGLGSFSGDVRLSIASDIPVVPLAFVRAADGSLSAMHDTVRAASSESEGIYTYDVPIFNLSTEMTHSSRLRLINPGDTPAAVAIWGRDDGGSAMMGTVHLSLPAGGARTLTAQQLEAGGTGLTGMLGAGIGRWRLSVSSDRPLRVVNIAETPAAGHWNNLSTTAARGAAPADRAGFDGRLVGQSLVLQAEGGRSALMFMDNGRFSETVQSDGMFATDEGGYDYAGLGPDAGRLTLDYDDGSRCQRNLYFSSRTSGWFASHCTGGGDPDIWSGGNWFVGEDEGGEGDGGRVETTYDVNEALPGVPASESFVPARVSGGSVRSGGGSTTIELNDGGYFELNDGTRYTCATAGGCEIVDGTVTRGTVTGTAAGTGEVDRFPTFRTATNFGNRTYTMGTAIDALTLPEATGGNGPLTYSLSPNVPGLTFDAAARRLTGTPSTAGSYPMRYTVRDADGDTATLGFSITVSGGDDETGALGVCEVGMTLSSGQSCTYPGTTDEFSINARGRGSFLERLAGIRIRINNETINGRVYDFEASHQGEGVWRIDRVAGRTGGATGGGTGTVESGTDTSSGSVAVAIPDANLRAAIEAELGKASGAPITRAEMMSLTTLFANEKGIRNLAGLETAGNLETLELHSNGIADISFLSGLTDLTQLVLYDNDIADISPLTGLTELTWLSLGGNDITDISPLRGLTKLWLLDLQDNRITNISPVSGLVGLSSLKLGNNNSTYACNHEGDGIDDISPLSNLIDLRSLELQYNNITDISPLSSLTNLRHLFLGCNGTADISPLAGLINLQYLELQAMGISDISPLSGLTSLEDLWLTSNGIGDISPLADLTNLGWLLLRNNSVSDISALTGLISLKYLDLASNDVSDISPLAGLTNLRVLQLGHNSVSDISALSGLISLEELVLTSNHVRDISPLAGLTALTTIDLRGNLLDDASASNHIAALESNGATVRYDAHVKGDYDIELVFTDEFSDHQKNILTYVARRWMAVIVEDVPDYEFARSRSVHCGDQAHSISAGEAIDDLRIYMGTFESDDSTGYGGPSVLREDSHLPAVGCMAFNLTTANLLITGLHEIGHVLGFGTIWHELGLLQDRDGDPHFTGPLAIAAFDEAGGSDYAGAKVPLEQGNEGHWRNSVLPGELMGPYGGSALSAITVQSLADLGYGVDVTRADAYTLPAADGQTRRSSADYSRFSPPVVESLGASMAERSQ